MREPAAASPAPKTNTSPYQLDTAVLESVKDQLMPLYEQARQTHSLKDIGQFAVALQQLSTEKRINPLAEMASNLLAAIDTFDIVLIENLMSKYHTLLTSTELP